MLRTLDRRKRIEIPEGGGQSAMLEENGQADALESIHFTLCLCVLLRCVAKDGKIHSALLHISSELGVTKEQEEIIRAMTVCGPVQAVIVRGPVGHDENMSGKNMLGISLTQVLSKYNNMTVERRVLLPIPKGYGNVFSMTYFPQENFAIAHADEEGKDYFCPGPGYRKPPEKPHSGGFAGKWCREVLLKIRTLLLRQ